MTHFKPTSERGFFSRSHQQYGHSVLGAPLLYFPADAPTRHSGLFLAGTHGDETAAITLLSAALRTLSATTRLKHHVILSVNPDGNQLGVRCNAHGVDLNRNFPTQDWTAADTVYRWTCRTAQRDVRLSSGQDHHPEPETAALIRLITSLKPAFVVSLHEPLACIDIDSEASSLLGQYLSDRFRLPLQYGVGYLTPGSFGTWSHEQQLLTVTVELPAISMDQALETYLTTVVDLLTADKLYE